MKVNERTAKIPTTPRKVKNGLREDAKAQKGITSDKPFGEKEGLELEFKRATNGLPASFLRLFVRF